MIGRFKRIVIGVLEYFRSHVSYSQDGEDIVLETLIGNIKKHKGFYVDVGAHHPVRFSNTWKFYRNGWKGINIDPTPGSMRPFRWLRSRDINLEIGIGPTGGNLTFYCFNDPALNTFDTAVAQGRNTGNPYRIIKEVSVPVMPLGQALEQYLPEGQTIDFLTIDVEGFDLAVLQSNDWDRFSPLYVLVEETAFKMKNVADSAIYQYLTSKDYEIVAALKRTVIYKRIV